MVMDPTLLAEPDRSTDPADPAAWSVPVALEDAPAPLARSSLPTLDRPGDWWRQRTGTAATPHPERPAMSAFSKALMTAIYPVADITAAKSWYAEVFGVEPYFDEPFYVGFNIAGYELGLVPAEGTLHQPGNRGVVAYWGVDSADEAWKRVTAAGAKPLSAVADVGGGIRVGIVTDPYGNALGIIENPHFNTGK